MNTTITRYRSLGNPYSFINVGIIKGNYGFAAVWIDSAVPRIAVLEFGNPACRGSAPAQYSAAHADFAGMLHALTPEFEPPFPSPWRAHAYACGQSTSLPFVDL
eukprot:2336837-Pleurochrysis_carterae.AAC.2